MAAESKSHQQAFSLLEMLVVIMMLGLLLSLTLPVWNQHLLNARRQQGWNMLQQIGLSQSVWYSRYQTYFADFVTAGLQEPLDEHYHYRIELTEQGYKLHARIRESGPQATDLACYQLQLDQLGRRQTYDRLGQETARCG
jgi:type IV pilus assembly protein PilE